jgi:serine/threonine protein kinase
VGEKSGLPYVVTRVIERAEPLAAKLDQPWAVDTAADLAMQVGQALEHAYNKGVVHGLLSPENIVVEDNGQVRVADIGLGELMDLVGAQVKAAASPYLAPERVAGRLADTRADVYSLGAVLYSLLTKRAPQPVQGKVLPPSHFNPDAPETLDRVVLKALDPDPMNRYPDVKTFLAVLGAVTLVPPEEKAPPVTSKDRCHHCGAEDQTGKFCRNCGARLKEPKMISPPPRAEEMLEAPIQITTIEVGSIEIGQGIKVRPTVIARPMLVAADEQTELFPEPLPMPELDIEELWPIVDDEPLIAMPEPPPMPEIDWAEVAPPMPHVPVVQDGYMWDDEEDD